MKVTCHFASSRSHDKIAQGPKYNKKDFHKTPVMMPPMIFFSFLFGRIRQNISKLMFYCASV